MVQLNIEKIKITKRKKKIKFNRASKISKSVIKVERLRKLTRKWTYTSKMPKIKILGHPIEKSAQSAMAFISDVYGLSRGHAIPYCINLGYKPFVKSNLIKISHWVKIKKSIERIEILEKRLKKFNYMSLQNNVKQGNFQSKKFWRGLPMHGQNARTNGNTARRLNVARLPANMQLKQSSPFLMVTKTTSRVLSKKLLPQKQGVSAKGQFARRRKKKIAPIL